MIGIKVEGRYLDLPGDARIRLKFPSQVFSYDFVSQGYSYPISLPYTPTNQRAMRHYDRIAITAEHEEIPCTIELGGSFWKTAVIIYRGFKDGRYDVDLQVPEAEAVRQLRDMNMTDLEVEYDLSLDWGTADIGDMNASFDTRLGTLEETDFIFAPIRNPGLFGDRDGYWYDEDDSGMNYRPFPPDEYSNYYDADRDQPWLYYAFPPTAGIWFMDMVPLPYLKRVMDHILDHVGRTLAGDVFRNEEVKTMVVLNNVMISASVSTNPGPIVFPFSEIGYPIYDVARLKDMLPPISGVDMLLRVCRRFNAVPLFREGRVLEIRSRVDILNDRRYEDLTKYTEPSRDFEVESASGLTLIELEESADTARDDDRYDPERIIGTVRLPTDLSTLSPGNADLGVVEVHNKVWRYFNGAWEELADYLPQVSAGTNPTSMDAGVGFTAMFRGEDTTKAGREWLVPNVNMKLSDHTQDYHNLGPNPIEQLRLLFFRGMQEDSNNDQYPLISNDIYDYEGDEIYGATMREALDGERGIYERWYATWQRTLSLSRTIKRRVRLPLHRLRNFQWDRKYRIDGQHYLCREIDVEFTATGMGIPVMELLRIPTRSTGVRLPIVCSGRGHVTVEVTGGTLDLTWQSSTGYMAYRTQEGILSVMGDGTPATLYVNSITVEGTDVVPLCLFSCNIDGSSTGDVSHFEATGGAQTTLVLPHYLQDMVNFLLNCELLEAEIDFSNNHDLQLVVLQNYPFNSLDLSATAVTAIDAPLSQLTSITLPPDIGNCIINLFDSQLTEAAVDYIFNLLYANSATGVTVDVSGGGASAPSAASLTARTWLAANGGTLTHN